MSKHIKLHFQENLIEALSGTIVHCDNIRIVFSQIMNIYIYTYIGGC